MNKAKRSVMVDKTQNGKNKVWETGSSLKTVGNYTTFRISKHFDEPFSIIQLLRTEIVKRRTRLHNVWTGTVYLSRACSWVQSRLFWEVCVAHHFSFLLCLPLFCVLHNMLSVSLDCTCCPCLWIVQHVVRVSGLYMFDYHFMFL
jgi:hypothetical protein